MYGTWTSLNWKYIGIKVYIKIVSHSSSILGINREILYAALEDHNHIWNRFGNPFTHQNPSTTMLPTLN